MARVIDADRMKEELLWGNVFLSAKETNALVDLIDNQPTLTKPNEPLTLEQLREMDGEPVWIDDEKTWALLQVWDGDNIDAVFPMPRGCFHAENVIGKKIFRRPPEGEADA